MSDNMISSNMSTMVCQPKIAEKIGINAALVIQRVHEYLLDNKSNPHFNRDGKVWVCKSYKKWQEDDFNFWSIETIGRLFREYVQAGYLIAANYNEHKIDNTVWYTINYNKIKELFKEEYITDINNIQ